MSNKHDGFEWEGFVCQDCGYDECLCEEPVVSDDDWDLGPVCGLDPEVCESCQ